MIQALESLASSVPGVGLAIWLAAHPIIGAPVAVIGTVAMLALAVRARRQAR